MGVQASRHREVQAGRQAGTLTQVGSAVMEPAVVIVKLLPPCVLPPSKRYVMEAAQGYKAQQSLTKTLLLAACCWHCVCSVAGSYAQLSAPQRHSRWGKVGGTAHLCRRLPYLLAAAH